MSNILMCNMADGGGVEHEMMDVKLIEPGAKHKGCAIGIGGPLLGCLLRKI